MFNKMAFTLLTIIIATSPTWAWVGGWFLLGPEEFWHKFAMYLLGLGLLCIQVVFLIAGYFITTALIWENSPEEPVDTGIDDAWA